MKSFVLSIFSAATLSLLSATATPVAAQIATEGGSKVVYSVDSLESTETPVDISIKKEVVSVDSLESDVSAPADKQTVSKQLVIKGVPTSIVMPVQVSTPADMSVVQPSNPSVKVERSSSVDVVVPAVQPTAEPVSPLANTKVKTATPVVVPVVNPSVDTSPSFGKTVSEEAQTSVVIPVPAPRSLEIPGESRVGNPVRRSRKASPVVGKKVKVQTATQHVSKKKAGSKVAINPVVGNQVTVTQPTSQKAGSKVAKNSVETVQPSNAVVGTKTVADPLVGKQVSATQPSDENVGTKVAVSPVVGTEIPAAQSSNLKVGSKVAIVNPAQPVSNTDSKAAASPLVSTSVQIQTATQPTSKSTGSKVAPIVKAAQPVSPKEADSKAAVSPLADTKAKVCDPANLESSIKIRAPDFKPSETRVAAKYSRPCSKITATLGYNSNVDQSSQRSVDLEVTQGVGDFEFNAKTNVLPTVSLQTVGIKWSNKKVTLEATRDFVEPSVKGKIGIEFPMYKGQPDTGLIELEVHALDNGPVDGRVAATYTRPTSKTKAVLGANFSNTATSADLEITQGIGENLEVTAKTGLLPAIQVQSLGMKLTRGGWSLEVKRDLLERAWEGQVQYSIRF